MWGSFAISNGNQNGGELGDLAAKDMLPADITVAQNASVRNTKGVELGNLSSPSGSSQTLKMYYLSFMRKLTAKY